MYSGGMYGSSVCELVHNGRTLIVRRDWARNSPYCHSLCTTQLPTCTVDYMHHVPLRCTVHHSQHRRYVQSYGQTTQSNTLNQLRPHSQHTLHRAAPHYPVTRRYYFVVFVFIFIFFCCTGNPPH